MSHYEAPIREPLILGEKSYHDITEDIARPIEGKANKNWYIAFYISLAAMLWGFGCIFYTVGTGIGVWGLNKTINWAYVRLMLRIYFFSKQTRYNRCPLFLRNVKVELFPSFMRNRNVTI